MATVRGELRNSIVPNVDQRHILDLTTDGKCLWLLTTGEPAMIWQVDVEGNIVNVYPMLFNLDGLPDFMSSGICFDGKFLWVLADADIFIGNIYKVATDTGNIVYSNNCIPFADHGPEGGLCFTKRHLVTLSSRDLLGTGWVARVRECDGRMVRETLPYAPIDNDHCNWLDYDGKNFIATGVDAGINFFDAVTFNRFDFWPLFNRYGALFWDNSFLTVHLGTAIEWYSLL